MLPLMLAAMLCCFISSCGSDDDSLDDNKNNGVVDKDDDNNDVEFMDVLISEENFPDWYFRDYLLKQDYGKDSVITAEEIKSITKIDVHDYSFNGYDGGIRSLKGIEYFAALDTLDCSDNRISSLDLSNNPALRYLNCNGNCYISSLDLSNNPALERLYCGSNQLTSLDVYHNPALERLYCENNQLTSLDVSNNLALKDLYCCRNQIKGEGMDALISSLPQNTTNEVYGFFVIFRIEPTEHNVCTKAQVAAAKAKGWTPYEYSVWEVYPQWIEYDGYDY